MATLNYNVSIDLSVYQYVSGTPGGSSGTGGNTGGTSGTAAVEAHEAKADPHPQYLATLKALSEFDTQQKRVQARENLELNYIDGGSF